MGKGCMGKGGEGPEEPPADRPPLSRDHRVKWIKKMASQILKITPEEWTNFLRDEVDAKSNGVALQVRMGAARHHGTATIAPIECRIFSIFRTKTPALCCTRLKSWLKRR